MSALNNLATERNNSEDLNYQPEDSLRCSDEEGTGPCAESNVTSPHFATYISKSQMYVCLTIQTHSTSYITRVIW